MQLIGVAVRPGGSQLSAPGHTREATGRAWVADVEPCRAQPRSRLYRQGVSRASSLPASAASAHGEPRGGAGVVRGSVNVGLCLFGNNRNFSKRRWNQFRRAD